MVAPSVYFDLAGSTYADFFDGLDLVWEGLDRIKPYILERLEPNLAPLRAKYPDFIPKTVVLYDGQLFESGFELRPGDATKGQFQVLIDGRPVVGAVVIYGGACLPDDQVQLGPGVVVETGAVIKGPSLIGADTEVRQGAYLRGSCLVGQRCVVGHVTEVKNGLFFDEAKAGHFAYVGDSILGRGVNLGAGTKLANLKISPRPTVFRTEEQTYKVDRRKIGAIIGDGAELGCNTVTNPGAVIGPGCLAAPNSTIPAGLHPARRVFRLRVPKTS